MKKICLGLLFAVLSATTLWAQLPFGIGAGPRVGTTVKDNKFIAGVQAEVKFMSFAFVPSLEKVFVKNEKNYNINLDAQYETYGMGVAKMFIGGGYVTNIVHPDGSSSTTNHGFDVQIGGKAGLAPLNLFGLVRYSRVNGKTNEALIIGVTIGM
jgi:hypothetical protein